MDDLSEKLASILGDSESMDQVRRMAESLLAEKSEPKNDGLSSLFSGGDMPDVQDLQKIMQIMSKLKSGTDDNRTRLLLALKPNLSEERQQRVDTAVKLLKMVELLPYIKEMGIFDF